MTITRNPVEENRSFRGWSPSLFVRHSLFQICHALRQKFPLFLQLLPRDAEPVEYLFHITADGVCPRADLIKFLDLFGDLQECGVYGGEVHVEATPLQRLPSANHPCYAQSESQVDVSVPSWAANRSGGFGYDM